LEEVVEINDSQRASSAVRDEDALMGCDCIESNMHQQ